MGLHLTSTLSQYMVSRFQEQIHPEEKAPPILPSIYLSVPLVADADRLVHGLHDAYRNTSKYTYARIRMNSNT